MAAVTRYVGRFDTQYDGTSLANENCTPASLSNCIRSATGGLVDKKPSQVRALVKRSEEQNPSTPGWSLQDADLAATRMNVLFSYTKGTWAQAKVRHDEGRMLLLQGDSDQFADGTCSGKFDGNHAIAVHPNIHSDGRWLTGDPICKAWRWEEEGTLEKYAKKFGGGSVLFGYTSPVPVVQQEAPVRNFELLEGPVGTLTVKTDAKHYYLNLSTGKILGPIDPAAFGKRYAVPVKLTETIDGAAGGDERKVGYLVGKLAAFLLATDVVFTANPSAAKERERIALAEAERIRKL